MKSAIRTLGLFVLLVIVMIAGADTSADAWPWVTPQAPTVAAANLATSGASPTIAPMAALGTGATATIAGNDTSGIITITGGTGSAGGDVAQITFATAFASAPKVIVVTAFDSVAANQQQNVTAAPCTSSVTATGWNLHFNGGPSASTTSRWSYIVLG